MQYQYSNHLINKTIWQKICDHMKKRVGVIIRTNIFNSDIKLYAMDTDIKKLKNRTKELNKRPSAVSSMGDHHYYDYILKYKWVEL